MLAECHTVMASWDRAIINVISSTCVKTVENSVRDIVSDK